MKNGLVKQLYEEEEIGFMDLWDGFVWKEELFTRGSLRLKPAFHGACFRRAAFSRATFCSAC